jgi:hypothetical protein
VRLLRPWLVASIGLLVAAPLTAFAQPAPSASSAAEAKTHLAAGDKAAAAKDWATAAKEYAAAQTAAPSAQALTGMANANYQLQNIGAAYEAYDSLLKRFPTSMGKTAQTLAETRLKELAQKTGALSIRVNETGAEVKLDEQSLGTSPVAAVVRVATGARKIKITKEGFAPFEATREVPPDGKVSVDVTLSPEANVGHLSVKEKGGQPLRVLVDGVDVGATPWEGDVPPGSHEVSGRSSVLTAAKQTVEVTKGKPLEVVLVGSTTGGRVEITTQDGQGIIYIDGKVAAEGAFSGELPAGPHVVAVKREGFETYEKKFDLADKQIMAETVSLRRTGASLSVSQEAAKVERLFTGVYGGLQLFGSTQIVGPDDSVTENCSLLGASSCDSSFPIGAGLFGYGGYMWNPVGLELFLGAMYDQTSPTANFDGTVPPGSNPVLTGPARVEQFGFFRAGGMAAARVRVMGDGPVLRYGVAAGVGFSVREMFMIRKTRTQNGQNLSDRYVPDGDSYVSPALTLDVFGQWRFASTTALTFGLLVWLENAGKTRAPAEGNHVLTDGKTVLPIRTPEYTMADGPQVFLGPYLGLMFGP